MYVHACISVDGSFYLYLAAWMENNSFVLIKLLGWQSFNKHK